MSTYTRRRSSWYRQKLALSNQLLSCVHFQAYTTDRRASWGIKNMINRLKLKLKQHDQQRPN